MSIHYHLETLASGAHVLAVSVTIVNPSAYAKDGVLTVKLPRWIPGSYKIRDYARNVINLEATAEKVALTVRKASSYAWHIECEDSTELTVTYHVYAYDLSVRGAYYDHTRCFFNPCCVFVEIEGAETQPLSVHLDLPHDWNVYTALPRDGEHFEAENYDHLIDCPVEAAPHALTCEFIAGDVVHHQVFTGQNDWQHVDTEILNHELKNIVSAEMMLFEGTPLDHDYTFMTFVGKGQYGGLEHCHSTALMASPEMLPKKGEKKPYRKPVVDFLGLCSHEYFHLWNVKRLKPTDLLPYNLYEEQHTEMLWMFEGFSSYYDELMLLRAGVVDKHVFLSRQAKNLTRVMNLTGRKMMTLAESSFDAWTKLYLADENASNSMVSYYSKGAIFSLYLDLWLRENSNNDNSLDDVMRCLWRDYACAKPIKGIDEDAVFSACAELVAAEKHDELQSVFVKGIHSCDDLDIAEMLATFAVNVTHKAETVSGHIATTDPQFVLKMDANKLKIAAIQSDSPAAHAGLSANDEIIAIDRQRHSHETANHYLKTRAVGQEIAITAARLGQLHTFKVMLNAAHAKTWSLTTDVGNELSDTWLATWVATKDVDRMS